MLKNIYNDTFTFWELFSKALNIFKEHFKYILLITLIIYIPINIIVYYLWEALLNSPEITFKQFSNYVKIIWWLETLIGVIASIFIIFLVKQSVDWEKKEFKEIFKKSIKKWTGAIWANILYNIWVGLLLFLLIVPWIIFAVYWIFFLYIFVLKNIEASKTFEYSKKLVKWRWWEIFGYWLFSTLSIILLWFLLGFTPNIEYIYIDISTSLVIDIYSLFVVILFTLKFLNIDKEQLDIIENNQENLNREIDKKDIEL